MAQSIPVFAIQSQSNPAQSTTTSKEQKRAKLKRIGKAVAIGALTGGLSGVVLGGGVLMHVVAGAGVRGGIAEVKERRKERLAKKQNDKQQDKTHVVQSASGRNDKKEDSSDVSHQNHKAD